MFKSGSLRCLIGFSILMGSSVLLTALPAHSNDLEAVATARDGVRDLGKNWNGEVNVATQALYMELQRSADRSGVNSTMDVSYGPHELQGMDVFVPEVRSAEPSTCCRVHPRRRNGPGQQDQCKLGGLDLQ